MRIFEYFITEIANIRILNFWEYPALRLTHRGPAGGSRMKPKKNDFSIWNDRRFLGLLENDYQNFGCEGIVGENCF